MANICSNYLKVGPTPEAGRAVLVRLSEGGFATFVPKPPDADNDWCYENWGTKWDIATEDGSFYLDLGKADFSTAWSPPTAWFKRVAAMFPELTFELHYEEPGERLWGWMKSEDGVLTFASEEPVSDDDDEEEESWPKAMRASAEKWYGEDHLKWTAEVVLRS